MAVVESELDQLHKMLVDVASKDLPADEKLLTFIYSRLERCKGVGVSERYVAGYLLP